MSSNFQLVHMLERVPPAFDGIGDFASIMASRLESSHGWESTLIPVRQSGQPESEQQLREMGTYGRKVEAALKQQSASSQAGKRSVLVLHFNQGGFDRNALHWRLNACIRRLKNKSKLPLLVFFHEMLPVKPPRLAHRILRPLQIRCARSLVGMTDATFTSNAVYARRLGELDPRARVHENVAPIFSNVGTNTSDQPRRPGSCLIFGSRGRALRSLRRLASLWPKLPSWMNLKEVAVAADRVTEEDVAREFASLNSMGVATRLHAGLGADAIGGLFEQSEVFFSDYLSTVDEPWLDLLFKSGTFAAANAHGVTTLIPDGGLGWRDSLNHPGLVVVGRDGDSDAEALPPDHANRLRTWYARQNDVPAMLEKFGKVLQTL